MHLRSHKHLPKTHFFLDLFRTTDPRSQVFTVNKNMSKINAEVFSQYLRIFTMKLLFQ